MIFGYCRISTPKQNIERQIRNILRVYPDAIIYKEVYTGKQFQGRKELNKILKRAKAKDLIVFDSVSRMSRNAEEGFELYQELYEKDIDLAFLKEPHINTAVYKNALACQVALTGTLADHIITGINNYLMALAKEQIRLAFEQSEKEVTDLRQRTREGMETARAAGKQIGREPGKTVTTKKSVESKKKMLIMAKDFGGSFKDTEVIKMLGIRPNTYYKYKKELIMEMVDPPLE